MTLKKSILRLKKLNVENSKNSESAEKLFNFYEDNQHEGNRIREPSEVLKGFMGGAAWVIEDTNGKIQGASFNFIHFSKWIEAGGTRVILEGYGLQKLFFWVRLLEKYLFYEADTEFITIVADWNKKSISNIEKMGFTKWWPDKVTMAGIGKLTLDSENKHFYRLEQNAIHQVAANSAQKLLHFSEKPILTNKRNNSEVEIVLDIAIIRNANLRKLLIEIANDSSQSIIGNR